MNADPASVGMIDEIWLFGSMLRRPETVGDIDLAITLSRRIPVSDDREAFRQHVDKQFAAVKGATQGLHFFWDREGWLNERALYGPTRHALLAGAQEGTSDLASLGVECRLIFDRQRGGRVDDPVLDRHPTSKGRDPRLGPPAVKPDLSPAPLRPMDGRWITGYRNWGMVCPSSIFRGWTDDAHRVFAHYPRDLRVLADGYQHLAFRWTPKALKKGGIDGRFALLIVDADDFSGVSVVLRRRIETLDGHWTLHAELNDVQLYRARVNIDYRSLASIIGAVSLILAVDAERMVRRAADLAVCPRIAISLTGSELPQTLQDFLVDPICDILQQRTVAIEPQGVERIVAIVRG